MSQQPKQDELHRLLKGEVLPAPDAQWAQALEQQVVDRAIELRHRRYRARWSFPSRWVIGSASAAACLVLAFIILFSGTEVTFASVQERIREADSMSFQTRIELVQTGSVNLLAETRSWADLGLGVRTDFTVLGQPIAQVILPSEGRSLFVDHMRRRYTPIEFPPQLDPERLRQLDPTSLVRRFGRIVSDAQPIKQVDTNLAAEVGFRIDGADLNLPEGSTIELWVDPSKQLPTRLVYRIRMNDRQVLRFTADRFLWQEPIDPALFAIDAPVGYVSSPVLRVPDPSEEAMLRTLRRLAGLSGGAFPSSDAAWWQNLAQIVVASRHAPLPAALGTGEDQRAYVGDLIAGTYFLISLYDRGAEPEYDGMGMRLGDADRVLMKWRLPGGATRAINGNLEPETLSP